MTFVPLFLPLVLLLYYVTKRIGIRNGILLAFSLVFYAWGEPKWIFVILLTVTVNFFCGLLIDRSPSKLLRTLSLLLGVSLSLAFLIYFKYFGFFTDIFTGLIGIENPFAKPVLPIGISFYTFQVLTYTVDVYRGKVPVQKNYAKLLLYVSFFPQLIAGPIVNYTDIAHQLDKRNENLDDIYHGFIRFFIGFAKKVLLANSCGIILLKPKFPVEYRKLTGPDSYEVIDFLHFDAVYNDRYTVYLCGPGGPWRYVESDNGQTENCLVVTDSFGLTVIPFLTTNYKQVHYYDARYFDPSVAGGSVSELIEKYQIHDIYVIVADFHSFNSGFVISSVNSHLGLD